MSHSALTIRPSASSIVRNRNRSSSAGSDFSASTIPWIISSVVRVSLLIVLAFRLWLVVTSLADVVAIVKRASRGLEPRCLPAWLGGSNLVHLHCALHRHLEHALNVAVLDQRLQVARRVDGRGPSGLSDQLRAGLAAVFQVDPVITSVDLLIAQVAVTRRIGDNGLTVSVDPVADSNIVAVLSVALYLCQRL